MKNYETMDAIPERRTRKSRVMNNKSTVFGQSMYYKDEPNEIHQREDKIMTKATWNSNAASRRPTNKGNVNPYKMR